MITTKCSIQGMGCLPTGIYGVAAGYCGELLVVFQGICIFTQSFLIFFIN